MDGARRDEVAGEAAAMRLQDFTKSRLKRMPMTTIGRKEIPLVAKSLDQCKYQWRWHPSPIEFRRHEKHCQAQINPVIGSVGPPEHVEDFLLLRFLSS